MIFGKNYLSVLACLFSIVATSCVTTHSGQESASKISNFSVSCGRETAMDAGNIYAFLCTIENKSNHWLSMHVSSIKFGDDPLTHILTPVQVAQYVEAVQFRNQKNNHNTNMALSGLLIAGAAASMSGDASIATAGSVAALSGAGIAAGRAISEEQDRARQGNVRYGSQHLLSEPSDIPGTLFVRRALMIESTAKGGPKSMQVCFDQPTNECLDVSLVLQTARIRGD